MSDAEDSHYEEENAVIVEVFDLKQVQEKYPLASASGVVLDALNVFEAGTVVQTEPDAVGHAYLDVHGTLVDELQAFRRHNAVQCF